MKFTSDEHEMFFYNCLSKFKNDCYTRSLFYLIGSTETTRMHFKDIYDPKIGFLPSCLDKGWQTSGSMVVCRLAGNLYTNCIIEKDAEAYAPTELFYRTDLAPTLFTAIKLRFEMPIEKEKNHEKKNRSNNCFSR